MNWEPWIKPETGLSAPSRQLPARPAPQQLQGRVVPREEKGRLVQSLVVGLVFASIAAYHGYKRTGSKAWAGVWGAGGFLCPIVVLPMAVYQGFANKKK